MKRSIIIASITAMLFWNATSCTVFSSYPDVSAAVVTDGYNILAIADITDGDYTIGYAYVFVNDRQLAFGMPIQFTSESGLPVDVSVPIYYSNLTGAFPTNTYGFVAIDFWGYTLYEHTPLTLLEVPQLITPADGDTFDTADDIEMAWNNVNATMAYVASYTAPDQFNNKQTEDTSNDGDRTNDPGLYLDYLIPTITSTTITAEFSLPGRALFQLSALNGATPAFQNGDSISFFITDSWTDAEASISDEIPDSSDGLIIADQYTREAQGFTFDVRESDPQQIAVPGTLTISLTMRRFRVSIAFIKAYDSGGNEYFSWGAKRIYNNKKREYSVDIPVDSGTTVIIGTHDALYGGGSLSF